MSAAGFSVQTVHCNVLISALGTRGDQWSAAMEAFEDMKERGLQPDVITFTSLTTACANAGKVRESIVTDAS